MSTSTNEINFPSGMHWSSQLSRLCRACRSVLTRDDLTIRETYPHHSSLEDFIEANRTNCYICSHQFKSLSSIPEDIQERLRLAIEVETPDNMIEDESQSTNDATSALRDDFTRLRHGYDCDLRGVSFTSLKIHSWRETYPIIVCSLNFLYEGFLPLNTMVFNDVLCEMWKDLRDALLRADKLMIVPDKAFREQFPMTLPSNTGSMETWSIVHSWIKTCSHNHDCMAQVKKNWYPTRLVERMSNETFRIIRSDSISQPGQGYITLSHRWGSLDFIKLTTDNVSSLGRPSPVSILPKTFREALVVAQRMNIRYVWIDSLCIIQSGDDGTDWQREAKEMANVYTNSFCNISADYGNNQSKGLFFERTPPFNPACMVYFKCDIPEGDEDDAFSLNNNLGVSDLRTGGLYHIMRPDDWFEDVLKSPLNRRGWVMQERLLAPRVLHFSPGEVSWECGQLFAWEKAGGSVGPDGLYVRNAEVLYQTGSFQSVARDMDRDGSNAYFRPRDYWNALLYRYSSFDLTNQSDKLVAISGVARRMAQTTGDHYVAGLWASEMPLALGWEREDDPHEMPTRQNSKGYYAPSFSWAAANGLISYQHRTFHEEPGLVTAFIKHRKRPLYSAVIKPGRPEFEDEILTDHVFGPLTSPEVEIRARGILRTCHRVPGKSPCGLLNHTSVLAISKDATDSAIHLWSERGIEILVLYDNPGGHEDAEANNSTYYFTVLDLDLCTGLLLESVDPTMGRFKRIGHIKIAKYGGDPDVHTLLGNQRNLPAWSYDEVTGEHVFYIV